MTPIVQRRIIFTGLALCVALALTFAASPRVTISHVTQQMYDRIEALPEGTRVLVSFDFDAPAYPEVLPTLEATLEHLFRRKLKVIALSLQTEGAPLGEAALRRMAKSHSARYGDDWVFLGFKSQPQATILGLGESFRRMFPVDYYGAPYESAPLLTGVDSFDSVDIVISISDGSGPINWAEYAQARRPVTVFGAVTAVMATSLEPYVVSGQVSGAMYGLRGAAEYERLLETVGGGSRGLAAQSAAHIYVFVIVALGNVLFWMRRRRA